MSKTRTDIVMLLDRSGSMASIADDMIGGFNAFIAEQLRTDADGTVTLYQFDDGFTEVYVERPLADVESLALVPRGRTALLDSIGRSIAETRARLQAKPAAERPNTVVFGIITDGQENASREITHAAAKALIERQEEKDGWTFLYLGANQDALEVGAGLGIARERSMTYTPDRIGDAMAAMSDSVHALRTARAQGLDVDAARAAATYSEAHRDAAMPEVPHRRGKGGKPNDPR